MTTLSLVRRGDFVADVDSAIAEVVQAVQETGKKGAITITLSIERKDTKSGSVISITDKIKQKLPELPTPETYLWSDDAGNLFEDDPRQGKLFDATITPSKDVEVVEPESFRKVM